MCCLQSRTTQVEVKTQIFVWSDFLDRNNLWSDFLDEIHTDQTFQTHVTSDQTFQRQKVSDQTFQTKVFWSDNLQTIVQTPIQSIAQTLIRLWSGSRGYDQTQMRSKHLWSGPVVYAAIYDHTEVRSKPVLIRLKCAPNSLIKIAYICYNIFFSQKLMFAVFNSSKEKSNIKVLLKKMKPNCWEQILFSVSFSVYFWLNGWV